VVHAASKKANASTTTLLGRIGASDPAALGLGSTPTYNELIAALAHNQAWLMIIIGVSFVFWTYVWLPINFLAATRAIRSPVQLRLSSELAAVVQEGRTHAVAAALIPLTAWYRFWSSG